MNKTRLFIMAGWLNLALVWLGTAAFVVLPGCASSPPIALQAAPEQIDHGLAAVGTLSDSANPADMAGSVVKTHLALYLRTAAKKLREGKIDVGYAKFARSEADDIHTRLDKAVIRRDLAAIGELSDRLDKLKINLEMK
jgi:hypothetical protein